MLPLAYGFLWNLENATLYHNETLVKLTKKETLLLQVLLKEAGKYLLRDTLIIEIWQDEIPDASHDNKLTQLIYRINSKLSVLKNEKISFIENSYALGYKISLQS